MIGKFREISTNENGAMAIVEASIVFPVMFIVLFFLIYMGNAFYIQAEVESVVQESAIRGAVLCSDPLMKYAENNKQLPAPKDLDLDPYRYSIGGMNNVESEISKSLKKELTSSNSTFFKNMKPKIKNSKNGGFAQYNNYVIYSTFSVEVDYSVTIPITFFGSDEISIIDMSSRSEVAVNDTPEFIRNTDMVIDMISGTKIGKNIEDIFNKIKTFLGEF